jgi:hypothetical protein
MSAIAGRIIGSGLAVAVALTLLSACRGDEPNLPQSNIDPNAPGTHEPSDPGTSSSGGVNDGTCGACAFAGGIATCQAGRCALASCKSGFANCNGRAEDGCETNLATDPAHCGACGKTCAASEVCSPSGCTSNCPAELVACVQSCVDTRASLDHCGICGHACTATAGLVAICVDSTCKSTCPDGSDPMAGACASKHPCYADADGDGFPASGTATMTTGACPPGTTGRATPLDCDDSNKDVNPNQTATFTVGYGPARNKFDYDCSGSIERTLLDSGGESINLVADCTTVHACGPLNYYWQYWDRGTGECGTTAEVRRCMDRGSGCQMDDIWQRTVTIACR